VPPAAPGRSTRDHRIQQDEDLDGYHDEDGHDEEDLEELGTPVYQGSGLSVRALTAEELQRFLEATTTSRLSCWAAAGMPWTQPGTPRGSPEPLLGLALSPRPADNSAGRAARRQPRQPWPLRAGRLPAAPRRGVGPAGPAAWPGGHH
jgi:hypothetical protein